MRRLILLLALVVTACSRPALAMPEQTPADFAALAETVFQDFVAAFPTQQDCIGRVEISGLWEMLHRGRYVPGERLIEVRIPATAPQLTVTILHELGHHLEHVCPDHTEVQTGFLEAMDLPDDTSWPDPAKYETNPSELWADAVVRHISGSGDTRSPLPVTLEAVEVVADWAKGELTHDPAAP